MKKYKVMLTDAEINLTIAALLIYGVKCRTTAKEGFQPEIYISTSKECGELENKLRKQFYESGLIQ